MPLTETTTIDFIDKEVFTVKLVDKEIVNVGLSVLDFIPKIKKLADLNDVTIPTVVDGQLIQYNSTTGKWVNVNLNTIVDLKLVQNEVPTKLTATRFRSIYSFTLESLAIYFNGQRLMASDRTIHSSREFSISISTITADKVMIEYIKA